jgi:3'-5' exoribonuclease
MWAELLEILRAIKDPKLRALVKKFCEDRELVAAFKRAPAAMSLHHPFIGGLLEHTLGVAKSAKAVLPLYPRVNADLVLAGVFLHDIGKTAELNAGTSMNYTDRGQLVGHITIAAIWIAEKARGGRRFRRTVPAKNHRPAPAHRALAPRHVGVRQPAPAGHPRGVPPALHGQPRRQGLDGHAPH